MYQSNTVLSILHWDHWERWLGLQKHLKCLDVFGSLQKMGSERFLRRIPTSSTPPMAPKRVSSYSAWSHNNVAWSHNNVPAVPTRNTLWERGTQIDMVTFTCRVRSSERCGLESIIPLQRVDLKLQNIPKWWTLSSKNLTL